MVTKCKGCEVVKKIISLLLITSILPAFPAMITADEVNVPSEWARADVEKAEKAGITGGYSDSWKQSITRELFCEFAYNMLESAAEIEWDTDYKNPFKDVDNEKVTLLSGKDIIKGKNSEEFAPSDSITREEAATILSRMVTLVGLKSNSNWNVRYDDYKQISEWAWDAVYDMQALGIMNGTDKGFEPKASYTVEQAVVTLMRLYRKIPMSSTSFADKLNAHMPDDKNYMFSPLSLKMVMAMAANGADGETRTDILNTLDIRDLDAYNAEAKSMIDKFTNTNVLKFGVANSVWINSDMTAQNFSEEYKNVVADSYKAESGIVNAENATEKINKWVNENTGGRISEIIAEENSDFWTMLINAVYFNAKWEREFIKEKTAEGIFTDRNGKESTVEFMNDLGYWKYSDTNGVQIIEMPYLNVEENYYNEETGIWSPKTHGDIGISMFVMMSDEEFEPEKELKAAEFERCTVQLAVPKFSIEYDAKLKEALSEMGMSKVFEENAQFSRMFDSGNMWISDVLHKTYISVDEEGTEAAAIASVDWMGASRPKEPVEVRFNKPFTFVIRDNRSNEILFMGEYAFAE